MKNLFISLFAIIIIFSSAKTKGENRMIDDKTKDKVIKELINKCGEKDRFRIIKGINQVAGLWQNIDGSESEFEKYCLDNFISEPEKLDNNFNVLSSNFEVLFGHANKISLDLKRNLHLDLGELLSIDLIFGEYDPYAHITDDLFKNKLAFFILLNFPSYSLKEKMELGGKWTRKEWAYARMGDQFISRVPAEIYQKISSVMTIADTYISGYNIYMGKLTDGTGKKLFNDNLKLISHWGLRDELKAHYSEPDGLNKQKIIYTVMKRIIDQEIPQSVIDKNEFEWNPLTNKIFKTGKEEKFQSEPFTRYQNLLNVFNAEKELDSYYPLLPTHMKRKFESEREIGEADVEKLFTEFVSSPVIKKTADLVSKRMKRKLEPFDIWYDGFKSRSSISNEALDKAVSAKYPNIDAFQKDIKNILIKLGFTESKSEFISTRIEVDPARGSGHAWGAEMKTEKAHLRTRVPKEGMNYKGFNIAMHELGHCVEQTLTLQNVDYYMLRGVPNTAFTEAFAFVFQGKDLDILGIKNDNKDNESLKTLDILWVAYEIMGVSLVDMKVWNWMYQNPKTNPKELKEAVTSIAKEVWNKYYAEIFNIKDETILAIYSHMIDGALYLPDYPLGHLIDFQIEKYLEGKNMGIEMERMCIAGKIIPQLWMMNAVNSPISIKPLIDAGEEAVKNIK
jgi:hypothetical protein